MKNMKYMFFVLFVFASIISASERKILIEVFTNSHCGVCPGAHNAVDNFLQTSNGNKVEYIYYHMVFPYSSDKLHQDNSTDAKAKNTLYGPVSSTPTAFFNGKKVSNSYSGWKTTLDNAIAESSNYEIALSGNYTDSSFTIDANVTKTGSDNVSDLTINFVVVETVNYQGNNGITNHKNVMRKIYNINGNGVTLTQNESKNYSAMFSKNQMWDLSKVKIIAYVQSSASKDVYQSQSIDYSALTITDVEDEISLSTDFTLAQNYPNPFNPATTISYTIPQNEFVTLKIYDAIGNEVQTLVSESKSAGNHTINFDASNLSTGIYFYKLESGKFREVKKMLLVK